MLFLCDVFNLLVNLFVHVLYLNAAISAVRMVKDKPSEVYTIFVAVCLEQ